MGTATAAGEHRTVEAAQRAIASPLLEAGAIDGARGILINITGSNSLKLAEVQQACTIIQGAAHEDANIIFGAVLDEKMKDSVKITVIATGFKDSAVRRQRQYENYERSHERGYDPVIISREGSRRTRETSLDVSRDASFDTARPVSDQRDRFDEPETMAEPAFEPEPSFDPVPEPAAACNSSLTAEVISVDAMRSNLPSYQAEDLDVPAFLRKRSEVM
jgi:cell division protein FtsZ